MSYNYSIKGISTRVSDVLGFSLNYGLLPKNVMLYDVKHFFYNKSSKKTILYSRDNETNSRDCAGGLFDRRTKRICACSGDGELHTKYAVLHESIHYLIDKIGLNNLTTEEEEAICDLSSLSVLRSNGVITNSDELGASRLVEHLCSFTFISERVLDHAELIAWILMDDIVPTDKQYSIRDFVIRNRRKMKKLGILYKEFRKPRKSQF